MEALSNALELALQAADRALRDILSAREGGRAIDTKTLKDITAALKDLSGIDGGTPSAAGTISVRFEGFAQEAAE